VAGFVGRHEHSLDIKGRVILPAKFRAPFEKGGYLSQHSEGCLSLWTPGEFERRMEVLKKKAESGRVRDRNRARVWASNSHDVEIDRQGRMAIPARLRDFAGLESEVLVLGAIDRVELWNPSRWEERVLPEESWLLNGDDDDEVDEDGEG
jgi:MraZ protein